jgi:hypothetical protein
MWRREHASTVATEMKHRYKSTISVFISIAATRKESVNVFIEKESSRNEPNRRICSSL